MRTCKLSGVPMMTTLQTGLHPCPEGYSHDISNIRRFIPASVARVSRESWIPRFYRGFKNPGRDRAGRMVG